MKRDSFYLVLRRYAYVPSAIATNANATMIVAIVENSGTVGVDTVVPTGVNTGW